MEFLILLVLLVCALGILAGEAVLLAVLLDKKRGPVQETTAEAPESEEAQAAREAQKKFNEGLAALMSYDGSVKKRE